MDKRHPYSLIGVDGNAFAIMGQVIKAMKQCGYSNDSITCYREEAMSGDYDNLLSLSVSMINNCNILSGFDEYQQLMKGHDNLEYVDQGYGGVQNRREKLMNESETFNFEDYEEQTEEHYETDNYQLLFNSLKRALTSAANELLDNKNIITKTEFRKATKSILDKVWDYLDLEIPDIINESLSVESLARGVIMRKLRITLNMLLNDDIKFSKYDVYHAVLQIITSYQFYNNLHTYMKD